MEKEEFQKKLEEYQQLKENKEPRGLLNLTIRELQELNIQFKDIFSHEDYTLNLDWDKTIKLINHIARTSYNIDHNVLNWNHTIEEALELFKIFLV